MRVLITGGAGYIGTHTLLEVLGSGHDVCVIDNFSNSAPEALERVKSLSNRNFTFHNADMRDREGLTGHLEAFQPDAVIHFAGLKAVGESVEKRPIECIEIFHILLHVPFVACCSCVEESYHVFGIVGQLNTAVAHDVTSVL